MRLKNLIVALAIIMGGCAYAPSKEVALPPKPELTQEATALVITRGTFLVETASHLSSQRYPVSYAFVRLDQHYYHPERKLLYHIDCGVAKYAQYLVGAGKDFDVIAIEPGTYVLENMQARVGSAIFMTKDSPKKHGQHAKFMVDSGEVVYLGDFELKRHDSHTYALRVEDNFMEAHAYLRANYPEYAKKTLKRRLMGEAEALYVYDVVEAGHAAVEE